MVGGIGVDDDGDVDVDVDGGDGGGDVDIYREVDDSVCRWWYDARTFTG